MEWVSSETYKYNDLLHFSAGSVAGDRGQWDGGIMDDGFKIMALGHWGIEFL